MRRIGRQVVSNDETDLAQSMGIDYTRDTVPLCEDYLVRFALKQYRISSNTSLSYP